MNGTLELTSYQDELAAAELAAREAGVAIMRMFLGEFEVRQKSKNNPVTAADLEANRIIHERIHATFPQDGWLSEEDNDTAHRLGVKRVWVVDPIDGTKEFIEGVPQFAISIGFVVDGKPKVAIVFNPAKDQFYKAVADNGAFLNDQPIRVNRRSEIDGAVLLVSRSEPQKKFQVFVDRCDIKPVGSIAYRLAQVAGGSGDGTLTFRSIHEWDICAGVLMVEAAGGTVLDGDGKPMTFNQEHPTHRGVVAASAILAAGLQDLWVEATHGKK